jgi:hypothetical protein
METEGKLNKVEPKVCQRQRGGVSKATRRRVKGNEEAYQRETQRQRRDRCTKGRLKGNVEISVPKGDSKAT